VAVVAAALMLPAAPAAAQSQNGGTCSGVQGDTTSTLGACSLQCLDQSSLDAETQRNCRTSGVIARQYPLDNYGIDVNVLVELTDPVSWILAALQWVGCLLWIIVLYVTNMMLLVMEWAFALPLLERTDVLAKVRDGLSAFHNNILGDAWTMAALSVGTLAGIWHGLVRRRTIETVTGLASTVALMIIALLLIQRPDVTIRPLVEAANGGALQVLAGASTGGLGNPTNGLAKTEQGLFDAVIGGPWCALQFGDMEYCAKVRDQWLKHPTNGNVRTAFFDKIAGDDDTDAMDDAVDSDETPNPISEEELDKVQKDPNKTYLQGADGTMTRIGLLLLITAGLVGANLLFGWLAFRLLLAAVFSLIYLMMAAAMLLVAALGEAGRQSFIAYLKRLLGQLIAKLIYAIFLGVAILEVNVVSSLKLGFFTTWALFGASWWGLFIHREHFIGFLSLDQRAPVSGGLGLGADDSNGMSRRGISLQDLFYAKRMMGDVAKVITAAPRVALKSGRAGTRVVRRRGAERASAKSEALRKEGARAHVEGAQERHAKANINFEAGRKRLDELTEAHEQAKLGSNKGLVRTTREARDEQAERVDRLYQGVEATAEDLNSPMYRAAERHIADEETRQARKELLGSSGEARESGRDAHSPSPTPMRRGERRKRMKDANAAGTRPEVRKDAREIRKDHRRTEKDARKHQVRTRRRR
jgi:hypothetical protein